MQSYNVRGDIIRVVAAQSGTMLALNGFELGPSAGLTAGEYYTFMLPVQSSMYLEASAPIQVMQYMEGMQARLS